MRYPLSLVLRNMVILQFKLLTCFSYGIIDFDASLPWTITLHSQKPVPCSFCFGSYISLWDWGKFSILCFTLNFSARFLFLMPFVINLNIADNWHDHFLVWEQSSNEVWCYIVLGEISWLDWREWRWTSSFLFKGWRHFQFGNCLAYKVQMSWCFIIYINHDHLFYLLYGKRWIFKKAPVST